jgi:transcriptional regulator with XRE-family HTH domain
VETSPSELRRTVRLAAGRSANALAAKAHVPTSTVTRIEKGTTDPTFTMLDRLLGAAGHDLTVGIRLATPPRRRLRRSSTPSGPKSTAYTSTGPTSAPSPTGRTGTPNACQLRSADPPRRTGTPFDAVLAGLAEMLAERIGIDPPRWTRSVPVPREPWAPPGTPTMRARAAATTPDAFRRRNIVLPRAAIFRDAA